MAPRPGNLYDVAADLSQTALALAARRDALFSLIDGLVQCAAILRITESCDPGAVNPCIVGSVASAQPSGPLVRADTVAHVGQSLQIGKIESVYAINGLSRVPASYTGNEGLPVRRKIAGHEVKALAVVF